MIDTPAFGYGSLVYHKTSGEEAGIIRRLIYSQSGLIYEVVWAGRVVDTHEECELCLNRPEIGRSDKEEP